MFHGRVICNIRAFIAALEFCEWVQVGIDVYGTHQNFNVKSFNEVFKLLVCEMFEKLRIPDHDQKISFITQEPKFD